MFRTFSLAWLLALSVGLSAADPPGLAVAESEPQSAAANGAVSCPEGRFIPLNLASGKPSLLLGNELAYLTLYPLKPGEAVNGIIYNAPSNAKTKRYTFPQGANWYAVAGELPPGLATATVNLSAVVNGKTVTDAPTVAGTLVVTLTTGQPPPGPGPGPGPGPNPPPPPVVTSFRVIFVTESATTLTAQQNAIVGAKSVRDYLNAKVTKSSNWPDWRNYDPQTTAANEYPAMKALWAAVKPNITTVPCIVVEVNGKADIIPWLPNVAETLTKLQSYGGK